MHVLLLHLLSEGINSWAQAEPAAFTPAGAAAPAREAGRRNGD